jgi:phosphohistidine swiveling domain-containing protein
VGDSIVDFVAPGPGRWELDRSHFPSAPTPIVQWLMEDTMESGMRRVMAELGVPADAIRTRFVNGYQYTRLRPLVGADRPPARLPPRIVLWTVARLHPEFRRRARSAARAERDHPAVAVVERWEAEIKPRIVGENRRLQAVDVAQLDDAEIGRHVSVLLDHLRSTTELHFWLHGYDLGPIARYLHSCDGWGVTAPDALAALSGASPSTSAPARLLAALRSHLDSCGADPATLDEVRAVSDHAAELLDAFLADRRETLVTGYDLTSLTLGEVPGVVVRCIRAAVDPVDGGADSIAGVLRARVPDGERDRFDAELAEARSVMDMRDDNGPITYEWPLGLLRRALLDVGRRLAAAGRVEDAEHALDLTPDEARDPLLLCPAASTLAERAERRRRSADLAPPPTLGPEEPRPPLDVLPGPLARGVAMIETALAQLDMAGGTRDDRMTGSGVGTSVYRGRVCRVASADEALDRLEPGDVLVVRATTPAFNTVLSIAGAVVTADGGPLSHAAVLARELGIPAVVGARGVIDLPDGAEVEVDPIAGTVRQVSSM